MSYQDYRRGKLEAYEEAKLIIKESLEWGTAEEALKRIQERIIYRIAWNKEELARLEKKQ